MSQPTKVPQKTSATPSPAVAPKAKVTVTTVATAQKTKSSGTVTPPATRGTKKQ